MEKNKIKICNLVITGLKKKKEEEGYNKDYYGMLVSDLK
jgi:hypothetical protein